MNKILAVPALALAALGLTAASASAAVRPPAPRPSVTSSYSCYREPTTRNHNGTYNYEEVCSLKVTIVGPTKDEVRLEVTVAPRETVTLYEYNPAVWIDGVPQPEPMWVGRYLVTAPYVAFAGAIPAGYREVYTWVTTSSLNQPRPVMTAQAVS